MRTPTPLALATETFQALLEGHRAHPDDDQILDDLRKARAAMERAWLEAAVGTRSRAV